MLADGACKGDPNPDMWFEPSMFGYAISVCNTYPLRQECLQEALDNNEEYGVWGGTMPYERGHEHDEDGRIPGAATHAND